MNLYDQNHLGKLKINGIYYIAGTANYQHR